MSSHTLLLLKHGGDVPIMPAGVGSYEGLGRDAKDINGNIT